MYVQRSMRPQYTYMTINIGYSHNTASSCLFFFQQVERMSWHCKSQHSQTSWGKESGSVRCWDLLKGVALVTSLLQLKACEDKRLEEERWGNVCRSTSELILQASTRLTIERKGGGGGGEARGGWIQKEKLKLRVTLWNMWRSVKS